MHSHIICNIDDGARSGEESIELVTGLQRLGFTKLITTPHIFQDYYPNTPETIRGGLNSLNELLLSHHIEYQISAASEYYGDEHLISLIKENEEMLTIGENYVLFEVSMLSASPLLRQIIFDLKTRGYQPVLAHPERYLYYEKDKHNIFSSLDASLQVNLLSLAGFYGKEQKKLGLYLIENDLVDFLGTDIHHSSQLAYLEKLLTDRKTMKLLRSKNFKNVEL